MTLLPPDLRRTWLFGPGADADAHAAMTASTADALIVDLEDFTPPPRRARARAGLAGLFAAWRARRRLVVVRINELAGEGPADLAAAMPAGPDVVALPMAASAAQIRALDAALTQWEQTLARPVGHTEILPVCETAAGVVAVREMAAASPRVRCALLGTEDLAADLQAERGPDGAELDYARRRFVVECRAAAIEPVDAPFTYADAAGAAREAAWARRLGYRSKALVRPDHAQAVNAAFTPDAGALARARALVAAFEAARERGEDRVLVAGQWVEVPTWRSACRVLAYAERLAQWHGDTDPGSNPPLTP